MTGYVMGAGALAVHRQIAAPADRVWAAVTDWTSHARWVALTSVRATSPRSAGVGASFVTRTGVGVLAFEDPMVVTEWQPPTRSEQGHCTLRKQGRILRGTARIHVTPTGPDRSRIDWMEHVEVIGLHRLPGSARLTAWIGRAVFGSVVRRMAAEIETAGRRSA